MLVDAMVLLWEGYVVCWAGGVVAVEWGVLRRNETLVRKRVHGRGVVTRTIHHFVCVCVG